VSAAHAHFLGKWELDPETLDYEHGRPWLRAVYVIEAILIEEGGGLRFTLDADDADGKAMHHVYGGAIDGRDVPIPDTGLTLSLIELGDGSIESTLKKNGAVIDRWTRTVLEDGDTMLITQHGFTADGESFRNNGVYRRVGTS
jgi:hypothetical protein